MHDPVGGHDVGLNHWRAADGRRLVAVKLHHLAAQARYGGVEQHLTALGFELRLAGAESHLCCGSAGTYSVLQPELASQLRDRKLGHLAPADDETIISANIGCIQHLQSGTAAPVRHWVEVLDDALNRA